MDALTESALSRVECLALLATADFGHLALTRRALPAVVPAHFALHMDRIVIHASGAHRVAPWHDGQIVTLHVDGFDDERRRGWSVTTTGPAHDAARIPELANELPRAPWLRPDDGTVIALTAEIVFGHRLGFSGDGTNSAF